MMKKIFVTLVSLILIILLASNISSAINGFIVAFDGEAEVTVSGPFIREIHGFTIKRISGGIWIVNRREPPNEIERPCTLNMDRFTGICLVLKSDTGESIVNIIGYGRNIDVTYD